MALFDANGKPIEVSSGSGTIADNSITTDKLAGVVKNVFDPSMNTEQNAFTTYCEAFQHPTIRSWGGAGSYTGAHFSYLIPVKPGESYHLQNINLVSGDNNATAIFYTADKEMTTERFTLSAAGKNIVVPETAAYMRVPVHGDTVDTVMVLTGTSEPVNVFIPYKGQLVPGLFGDITEYGVPFSGLAEEARFHRFRDAKVGCLGDSLTNMATNGWIKRLAELMGFASITNYGMSGTTVTSARGEGDSTYRDRAVNMADDLDLIIVLTSINDYGSPIGIYNPAEKTGTLEGAADKSLNDVSTIAGAGLELIRILREKYPFKDIVFFSHPHPDWGEWCYQEEAMYKTICSRNAVPFFELLSNSGLYGAVHNTVTHYYIDGTHLSEEGNDRLAEYMAASLRSI